MTRKVLVTGGAGFIGSHVADAYRAAGDDVTVLDDLSTGKRAHVPTDAAFVQADVRSPAARELLAKGGFTLLNHHAAQMDVRRSVADPVFDADVNVLGLLNLLEGARLGGYLARSHDGPPGWRTIWQGWLSLQPFLEGVHFACHLRLENVGKNQASKGRGIRRRRFR